VTVLARDAATADAAATLIANAVDLPGHPGVERADWPCSIRAAERIRPAARIAAARARPASRAAAISS
jgi:ApbE superfamily uncharacterized protein (UPF0280 family)